MRHSLHTGIIVNILFASLLLVSSCKSLRIKLKDEKPILYKTIINGNKNITIDELEGFRKQIPNRNVLGTTPYITFYKLGKLMFKPEKYDKKIAETDSIYNEKISNLPEYSNKITKLEEDKKKKIEKLEKKKKEGNWLMATAGEPPVYYDSSLTNLTVQQMSYYLRSKGYFNSSVSHQTTEIANRVFSTYTVEENEPYRFGIAKVESADNEIRTLVENSLEQSAIVFNERYDVDMITAERDRIDKLLRNNGYFNFNKQFINFDVDTNVGNRLVNVFIIISNPATDEKHFRYRIGNIYFTTDASLNFPNYSRDTVLYNDINYIGYNFKDIQKNNGKYYRQNLLYYRFSSKVLGRRIELAKNNYYSYEKSVNTQQQLANIEMFKFININYLPSTDSTNKTIDIFIRSTPFQKFQLTDEWGVSVSQLLPGPFGKLTFRARNPFRTCEVFDISLYGSIEGQASYLTTNNVYSSKFFGVNTSLIFPRVISPLGIADQMRLMKKYNAKTRVSFGLNYENRPEYTMRKIETSFRYLLQKGRYSLITISPLELSINDPLRISNRQDSLLQNLLINGNTLIYSFRRAIVSDMSVSYSYNSSELGKNKLARYFKISFESGGTSLNLLNKTFLARNDSLFGMLYFRYLRAQTDYRQYIPIRKYSTVAFRISAGAAYSYDRIKRLPFDKFFFSGGSNSIRGWVPQRIGPGAYSSPSKNTKEDPIQPGEMQLEANIEYRFKLVGVLRGALFADAGNVWMINMDQARPGSQFKITEFYKQIAVGSGFGLRFDFSFLIIRLDYGLKIVDPSYSEGKRFIYDNIVINNYKDFSRFGFLYFGIGYPF